MADPVWLMVMFDLPVKTKNDRKLANRYRHVLLDLGFDRMQLSVYAKYYLNGNATGSDLFRLQVEVPPGGAIRIMRFTDAQWAGSIRHLGPEVQQMEEKPEALDIF